LSTASWQSENAEGTSRVFTRTKRNFSAETLANRAAKKDQYVLKEERLSTYSFIARDIFVDDVDEEEVESDEVVDGQFYKFNLISCVNRHNFVCPPYISISISVSISIYLYLSISISISTSTSISISISIYL
jgi:hypothetical protein